MTVGIRVVERLNGALHRLMEADPNLYVVGEDVADPYGGAFKVTRGLSTRFPDRVLTTPISEQLIMGVANGLALSGNKAIAEFMFGDFAGLAFDQILNVTSKTVSMFGRHYPMPVLIRCPIGAQRGYGPTHSQSLQKHFVGIPNVALYELSAFHDFDEQLSAVLARGTPSILFEDKVLYTRRCYRGGTVDDLLRYRCISPDNNMVEVFPVDSKGPDCVLLCPGGVAERCLAAARTLLLDQEIDTHVFVPFQVHPLDLTPLHAAIAGARMVAIVEESFAGGTWGASVAVELYARNFSALRQPIELIHCKGSVVPSALHLEAEIVVSADMIVERVRQALGRPAVAQ